MHIIKLNRQKMFSIIIPLYNKSPYIEKAIRSVVAQTYQEFELIIVDDGSKDDGFSVVQQLFATLTPPLGGWGAHQQPNQGVSTARNNGVKLAKYDYIAFLDADDWWDPTYLGEMKRLIESYPEAGIYGCRYSIVKNGKKRIAPIGVASNFESGLINYCRVYAKTLCMPLWTGATIIKKRIFEAEQGFKRNLKLGEDFDLWVRVATKHPVAFLNKPLANYNQDVDITSRAIGEKMYEAREHMLFTDYGKLNDNPEFLFLYERLALYGLLPYYLKGNNKEEVEAILSQIHWKQHELKYRLYYLILPKEIISAYNQFRCLSAKIKKILTLNSIFFGFSSKVFLQKSSKMKIIQIGSFPINSATIQGGVEASVYGLAMVQATNHEVVVIDVPRNELNIDSVEELVNIKVYRFSAIAGSNYTSLFRIPKIVSVIRSLHADICHIHTTSLFSFVTYILLKLFRIKTVVTIHGLAHKEKQNTWKKGKTTRNYIKYISHSFTEFLFLSICPQFIVDTCYVEEAIKQYKMDGKLLRFPICKIIPQGINNDFFHLKSEVQSGQLLSVGSINERKGHLLLIEAMVKIVKENPMVKLNILGALSDTNCYVQMQQSIVEKGLEQHINIYPNIAYDEMLKFYRNAQLFVLHTEEESQGIVFCEAIAAGLPVIATNVGGVPWVVEENENGLLSDFNDIDTFSTNILRLLSDDSFCERISVQNRTKAQKYNWENIANEIMVLYKL